MASLREGARCKRASSAPALCPDSIAAERQQTRWIALEAILPTIVETIRQTLRLPALDQLGLLTAIREQAAQLQRDGLEIAIAAPERLPPLPAAVEVAAYRIVQEALTNVARHAHARRCTVTIAADEALMMTVADDGIGLPEALRSGVGLSSMHERAEEIGGSCLVERGAQGGTRIQALLPLIREHAV